MDMLGTQPFCVLQRGCPSNQDILTGPKGGRVRGSPLYVCKVTDFGTRMQKCNHITIFFRQMAIIWANQPYSGKSALTSDLIGPDKSLHC